MAKAFDAWQACTRPKTVDGQSSGRRGWTAGLTKLALLDDGSIFASGDTTKRDVYTLTLDNLPATVTAIRLEALPDERLPAHGPGRAYYEGPKGDFFLSEIDAEPSMASR